MMRFFDQKPDYFDQHRKNHSGRAMMIVAAIGVSLVVWAAIIGAISKIV